MIRNRCHLEQPIGRHEVGQSRDLAEVIRPVAPPRVLETTYSSEEFGRLLKVLRTQGPWDLIIKHHFPSIEELLAIVGPQTGGGEPSLDNFVTPAFRGFLANHGVCFHDELHDIFYNQRFMEQARAYWGGAKYAQPYMMLFNLQAPAHCYDPGHLDSPGFRGMWGLNTPIWLLSAMARSGLFTRWMLKTAQVIAWYYDSPVDGGFTYWPDGPLAQPQRLAAPFLGKGVVVQNEMNYHRGEASGPPALRDLPPGFSFDSTISADPDSSDGWLLKTGEKLLRKVAHQDMRYLFHWSCEVFSDQADLQRRVDHADDITPDRALDMLIADMRDRGARFEVPADPMIDGAFIELVGRTYSILPASYPVDAVPDISR